jgi:hypothetical protein
MIGNVVRRPGLHRLIAARQLVLPLRARFHAGEAHGDGRIDGLIIAQLEMQEGLVDQTAPIAAIERVGADEVERAGHRLLRLIEAP